MNGEKYLLVLTSYINNDVKRDVVVETLKSLKEENIDVCVVMHSNEYTNDIIPYVKYLYYDYDNEYIMVNDFYQNMDNVNDTNCSIGSHVFWLGINTGFTENYVRPEYSKPALSLFRNGAMVAYSNKYDWVVYLEYDIPTPVNGYKKLIENKILNLKNHNKNCFFYTANLYGPELIWPAIFICSTKKLFENGKNSLVDSRWHLSKKDWISYWGNTGFEYCLQHILKTIYEKDLISERIETEGYNIWLTNDYVTLSRSYQLNNSKNKNIIIHLYPYKQNNNYELILMAYNASSKNSLENIRVVYDDNEILNIPNIELHQSGWYMSYLPNPQNHKEILLSYDDIQEKFLLSDIEKIHKYILKYDTFPT